MRRVPDFADLVAARAATAGLVLGHVDLLARYLERLAEWNRTINLTGFDLDAPTDAAIDRLIIEPLTAASEVRPEDRVAVDIGSGGGSPGIPLALAARNLAMTLVESRERKAAFLRSVVRELDLLPRVYVSPLRFDASWRRELHGTVDLVTLRAVAPDVRLTAAIRPLLKPTGRMIWFADEQAEVPGLRVSRVTEHYRVLRSV